MLSGNSGHFKTAGPKALLVRALRNHAEAARRLARNPDRKEEFVHQLRTGVKRLRASWRLLRPALPDAAYRRENLRLRNLARGLSALRERDAIVRTLKRLLKRPSSEKDFRLLSAVLQAFRAEPEAIEDDRSKRLHAALAVLSQSSRSLEKRDLRGWDWKEVETALSGSYRKSRKAYRRAEADTRDEVLHTWRKRIKDLEYQLEALSPAFPAVGALIAKLDKLQDVLGDAQDLAVLEARMAQEPSAYGGKRTTAALLKPLRREKRRLSGAALHRGGKFFRTAPRRFIRSIF